jgi:hypothetical protein
MKEALMEVRSFRDTSDIEEVKLGFMARNRELAKLPKPIIPQPPIMPVTKEGGPGSGPQKGGKKHSSADIKKAYGILNDPRYKQGNYSGAAKAIDKLSPGLSNHPDVKNAMKRANEALDLPATGDTTTSNASQEDIVERSCPNSNSGCYCKNIKYYGSQKRQLCCQKSTQYDCYRGKTNCGSHNCSRRRSYHNYKYRE